MASELSKFIEDELLREGNTGERSQLINGGTFNVEKPRQGQARSNIFSKRNIACFVILIVVAGAVGTAIYHKDKAASKIQGWKKSNKGVNPKHLKPTPGSVPNKHGGGPAQAPSAAPPATSPVDEVPGTHPGKLFATAKLPGKQPKRDADEVSIANAPLAQAPAASDLAAAPGNRLAPADQVGRKLLLTRRIRS